MTENINLADLDTGAGDGAQLLDEVRAFLDRFVAWPSPHASVATTLWAAHTHLADRFESTPRLAPLSPEKQSGKTRVLELLDLLCAGAEMLNDASAAYLFRRIGAGPVTVMLDECDAIWKRGKSDDSAEALRSIVNAGHRKRATVGRVDMNGKKAELVRFPVYAPVAMAGIGDCLPDTILDRAVVVRMRRRAPDERIEQFRERTCRAPGEALRDRLATWAASVAERVGAPWPDMPAGVADRPADVWEPLLAVAELAGGNWPELAREACKAFVLGTSEDTASVGVRLLADLHDVFDHQHDALWTETILEALHKLTEAPWGEWYGKPLTDRGLARLLKPYRIKSCDVKLAGTTRKGYRREHLWDAWRRYLPHPCATCATCATGPTQPSDSGPNQVADGVADTGPRTLPLTSQALPPLPAATSEAQKFGEVAQVAEVADSPGSGTGSDATPDGPCRTCGRPQPQWVLDSRGGNCIDCHRRATTTDRENRTAS